MGMQLLQKQTKSTSN